jgi:predicted MFS family arabinose efflux permease
MSTESDRLQQGAPAARQRGSLDFLLFWTATSISQVGDEVYTLAIPLIAYAALRSASAMTFLYGLSMLPHLVFGVAGGAWADRNGKKLPILSLSAVATVVLTILAIMIIRRPPTLLVLSIGVFLLAIATSALLASYDGALNDVVRTERRLRMISMLESSRTVAVVIGPALAGALIAVWRGALPLLVDAASFALAAIVISLVSFSSHGMQQGGNKMSMAGMIREGLAYAWRTGRIRFGVLVSSSNNLLLGSFEILVIFKLRGSLGVSGAATGVVFSVGGAAALLAAVLTPRLARAVGLRRGMAIGMTGIGISAAILGLAPDLLTVGAAQCLEVSAAVAFNILWRTYRQNTCDSRMISRVSGACRGIAYCSVTVGAWLCSVLLAAGVSTEAYLLAGGLIVGLLGLVTPWLLRDGAAVAAG